MSQYPTVFIVEDEPLTAATIQSIMTKLGFIVLGQADSYSDALSCILKVNPDVVLLDINLYGISDGIDVAFLLERYSIPFFYISSLSDPITRNKLKGTSPLGFIDKPFTPRNLKTNVAHFWYTYQRKGDLRRSCEALLF